MKKLLLIDDYKSIHEIVHLILGGKCEIIDALSKEEALDLFDSKKPDIILLDIEFKTIPEGWEILKIIRQKDREVPIFLMSANGHYREHALACLASGFIEKPFSVEVLTKILLNGKGTV